MKTEGKSKNDRGNVISGFLTYGLRSLVLILFVFLFVEGVNPARISDNMGKNVSLIKTTFFFKGVVSNIISESKTGNSTAFDLSALADNSTNDSEESYDDFYASFAAMMENSSEDSFLSDDFEIDDDESDDENQVAEKIKLVSFKESWATFADEHPEIASAFKLNQLISIFTFISVIICLAGFYFACGKNKIKQIGELIIAVGTVLTCITLPLYNSAFNSLVNTMDTLEVSAKQPVILPFMILSILTLLFAISAFVFDIKNKFEVSEKDAASKLSDFSVSPFQITFRIIALLLFVLLFIPGVNPARISENISRNVSLFTSGISYTTYVANIQRVLIRGWLPEYVIRIAWISSLLTCLGVIACSVGSCMSIGNNKLKRLAHFILFGGCGAGIIGLAGIYYSYNLICSSEYVDKILPLEPASIPFYLILIAVVLVCTAVSFLKTPAPEKDEGYYIEQPYQLFLMLLPFLILVFLFSYLPLWGWRYAFFDYNAGDTLSMDNWVGLKWFKAPFTNAATRSDIIRVLRNTMAMSGLGILFSWLPMIFAIFLAEIKNSTARRVIQTLTTVPNFISWVLVYAIAFCIFGTEGFISNFLVSKGVWAQGKNMLMGDKAIWLKMWMWGTWKSLGWSAIMYIAAISGIDQQLYEAATVDGAGRFQKIFHITIPELLPTYLVLLILSVSNILSNGMDQYLVFKNPTNKGPIEVLDLYVYQLSFGQTSNSQIPFSTVVSMFKSLVSVVLLFITNKISKLIRGSSIF